MSDSDGQEKIEELRFRVGDAFPPDDPLARFILVVSMGLNDNSLANTRFVTPRRNSSSFTSSVSRTATCTSDHRASFQQ